MCSASFGCRGTQKAPAKKAGACNWFVQQEQRLLVDRDNNAGTYGAATLTDSEAQAFLDSDRGDQLNVHLDVIARHAHLGAFRQGDNTGYVGGTEVELGTVVVEERS